MKKAKILTNTSTRPHQKNGKALKVQGVTSLAGTKYVKVTKGRKSAYVPYDEFMPGGQATRHLREQNFVLPGAHYREFCKQVDDIRSFPRALLVERQGWASEHFALPCGTVLSPAAKPNAKAIFACAPGKCAKGGEGPQWRDGVAALVAEQPLPAFMVMVAFAAPLLRLTDRVDNFGFEVVGRRGTGKTTVLRLMSTTVGAGIDAGEGVYWQTLDSTMAGLETTMQRHQDLPLILDEAGLFMPKEGKIDRASSMVSLAFQLGSGHPRARWGDPQPVQYRFIFAISSNEPASRTMQGNNYDREAAALDRLLTLPVLDGENGVFDTIPEQYPSGADFSAAIDAAMRRHYGRALPRFLELLVEERDRSDIRVRRKISTRIKRFRRAAGVDTNNGSAVRVCDAFGLVYAAGVMARRFKVLPRSYNCKEIALGMYRRHLASRDDRTPIGKILELSRSDRVWTIPEKDRPDLSLKDIEARDGVVFPSRKGSELLLTQAQFRRLFPLAKSPLEIMDLRHILEHDSDHHTVKRKISPNLHPMRFFCCPLNGLSDN